MTDENSKSRLNVSIGKQIDAALGDIIRGLLHKPSEEAGNLIANGIGILGDRIKLKRELNASLGLEKVRRRLSHDGVEIDDITPVNEEDLHLLLTGLSLSGDEGLRDLWAGLFAKALEPESGVTAERPYIAALQSLSPMDAKIIDFLACVTRLEFEMQASAQVFRPADFLSPTPEETKRLNDVRAANRELQQSAIKEIETRALEHGIDKLLEGTWSENLIRLGIIEKASHRFVPANAPRLTPRDGRSSDQMLDYIQRQFRQYEEEAERKASPPERVYSIRTNAPSIHLHIRFTGFGLGLVCACGLLQPNSGSI